MSRKSIQALSALSKYCAEARGMPPQQLMREKHNSRRLGRFMRVVGVRRFPHLAAHAVVSGQHSKSRATRLILAKFGIRIDDPDNGVFLPKNNKYIPHIDMPKAVNHASLHSTEYYDDVYRVLSSATSEVECRASLKIISRILQNGGF